MHKQLFSVFLFVISIVFLSAAEGEPEVMMVNVNPSNVDNQQDEEVHFEGDCNICNEDELAYFYWNSSISGIIHEGTGPANINFMKLSSEFNTGEHNMTLQVSDNEGVWSEITEESTTVLNVAGRDDTGGGDGITVNFQINPPSLHLGQEASFAACTTMSPEPQPCHEDMDVDLDFYWEIQWEGETEWSYLGNTESFDYVDFVEGTHTVRLTITTEDSEASGTIELNVLPPIPIAVISGSEQVTIKEGQILDLIASCYDNNMEEIECSYVWEIWEDKANGDMLYTFDSDSISLSDLTNEINKYDVMVRATDDVGTASQWTHVYVTVNPTNVGPTASITIFPDSLGGLTPEYYQFSELTFSSSNSQDSDGLLVAFKWMFNGAIVSTSSEWVSSFDEIGMYQIKLGVQDDNGIWSSNVSRTFKIIENTAPTVDFTVTEIDSSSFIFNSTSSDSEGSIVAFEWLVNNEVISNVENITWSASASGKYDITFRAMDDGGLWSETTQTIEATATEQKNFVASFSSKEIQPGDILTIDFSGTTGNVDRYEIIVNNPDGSQETYETNAAAYTLTFDVKGKYTLDITVFWADGIPQPGLGDWYGPTIYVGVDPDAEENSDDSNNVAPEPISDEGLPSLTILAALMVPTLVAISRRQR